MKNFLLLFLVFSFITANAQKLATRWAQGTFGYFSLIKTDPSGNIYVSGLNTGAPPNILISKFNSAGSVLWSIQYDGGSNLADYPAAMVVDASGNVYVTGYSSTSSNKYIIFTVKYSSTGTRQWAVNYGASDANSLPKDIYVDASGNVYVAGQRGVNPLPGSQATDPYPVTLKYNSSGVLQWAQFPALSLANTGLNNSVIADATGNVYSCGQKDVYTSTAAQRIFTTYKYSATGTLLWQRTYGMSPGGCDAKAVKIDINGNIVVGGVTVGIGYFGYTYGFNYVRYTPDGQFIASNNLPDVGISYPQGTANLYLGTDLSGNVYLGGTATDKSTARHENLIVSQYSAANRLNWTTVYNHSGTSREYATGMAVDMFSNVYMTGTTLNDYLTIKLNPQGIVAWKVTYNSPANASDYANGIALFTPGSPRIGYSLPFVYVTGTNGGGISYTLKYEQVLVASPTVLDATPQPFALNAFPNPSHGNVTVQYSLPEDGEVNFVVRDVSGRIVKVLNKGNQSAGTYTSLFGTNQLPGGVYHLQLETANINRQWRQTKQLVIVK